MKNFKYIEVGTSNYDTLAHEYAGVDVWGISIEPVKELLDELPTDSKKYKVCGVLNHSDMLVAELFRVSKENQKKYNLPDWVDSSSSLFKLNPNIERELKARGVKIDDAVEKITVRAYNWFTILANYGVSSVEILKVDAEGADLMIVESFLETIAMPKWEIDLPNQIIFEARDEMTDQKHLEKMLDSLAQMGYTCRREENNIHAIRQ